MTAAISNPHAQADCTYGRACVQNCSQPAQLGIGDTVPQLRALLEASEAKRLELEAAAAAAEKKHRDEIEALERGSAVYLSTINEAIVAGPVACTGRICGTCWRCVLATGLARHRAEVRR